MKKPWLAYLLNFLLPGAGLAYLGHWGWAVADFLATFGVAVVLTSVADKLPPEALRIAAPILGVINGSIAINSAKSMNQKLAATSAAAPPPAPVA